jgi:hypothetical protein
MKKQNNLLMLFIVFIALAIFFTGCGRKSNRLVEQKTFDQNQNYETIEHTEDEIINKPWIEVVVANVYVSSENIEKQALLTGDIISEEEIIETDKNGLANIYFPDGSVMRLDSNTKIKLTSGMYDDNSKTLVVRVSLLAGNLWSKIINLVTPESVWEVKSHNAVAAVRGTAFGVSAMEKATTVIGHEHIVSVTPFNSAKKIAVSKQETFVGEKQSLTISLDDIPGLMTGNKKMEDKIYLTDNNVYESGWVATFIAADEIINQRFIELQNSGLNFEQAREIYKKEIIKKFSPKNRQIYSVETIKKENNDTLIKTEIKIEKEQIEDAGETNEQTVITEDSNEDNNLDNQNIEPIDNEDDTWSDIPVSTDTDSNLGQYFLDFTVVD